MLNKFRKNRLIAILLSASMLFVSVQPAINAAMVTSSDLVAEQQSNFDREYLLRSLDREEVQRALVNQGVDIAMAKERVASMTDAEIRALNQRMDEMPAGSSSIVGAIVLIFLVLLFTDIMGWTDVFPFVKKTK